MTKKTKDLHAVSVLRPAVHGSPQPLSFPSFSEVVGNNGLPRVAQTVLEPPECGGRPSRAADY